MAKRVRVRFEQAVYGSFPFWDKGYAILAQSPGCRPEWLTDLKAACQRHGERPAGAIGAGGLFAIRLPSGPWAIVGVGSPGADDRGRPDALAFHALLLTPRMYRKAGASPFGLVGALRRDWGPADARTLPASTWMVDLDRSTPTDPSAPRIAEAIARGRRVALEADGPIDPLAEAVWAALPERTRRRASVATWAFGNGNRFDLAALPRLEGVTLDDSYVNPATFLQESPPPPPTRGEANRLTPSPLVGEGWGGGSDRRKHRLDRRKAAIAIGVVATALALAIIAWTSRPRRQPIAPTPHASASASLPPERSSYPDRPADPDERARVAEALLDLAERFGVVEATRPGASADPTALMERLAARLRYRGPWLAPSELERLEADRPRDPAAARALDWHAQVGRFADDRPLPAGFERGPLRWQLDTLAWSFHLEPDPIRSPAEVPHGLARDLAVDGPIRPNPLADRHPALADYAAFLGRLPRR